MSQKPSPEVGANHPEHAWRQALELLACPACLAQLLAQPAALACTGCGRVYPVLDGIPILLVDRTPQRRF
jgi:uncharacterized protein YbaR (Trm112 family)